MNLDEKENYRQQDQDFQDDETRYEEEHQYDDIDIDAPPADHSISDNAEPDYGNDFAEDEISNENLANPDGSDEDDDDDDEEDEDDSDGKPSRNDLDEDPSGTDPNRNM